MPLATEPLITASSVGTQAMTESVWLASMPPAEDATSVGVGVVPECRRAIAAEDHCLLAEHQRFKPRLRGDRRGISSKPSPLYGPSKSTLVSTPMPL